MESAAMDRIHQYIRQQALERAQKPSVPPGFIGPVPPPPSSTFMGQRWLRAGRPDEPIVGVMFRCSSPPSSASRHVLLHLKPSVTEESLASKLCEIFQIPANGGIITKTMPKLMPGMNGLLNPNKVYSWAEIFEILGSTMAGFVEVTVISVDDMSICTNCGDHNSVTPAMLSAIRKWCFGVNTHCGTCFRAGALPANVIETCMSDGRTFPTFRI